MFKTLRALSIKTKLILIALSLLVIPWMGNYYVQEMRQFLLRGQQDAQLLAANGIATVLNDRQELFNPNTGVQELLGSKNDLYAHGLPNPIQLDGQIADWETILEENSFYVGDTPFSCEAEDDPDDFSLSNVIGYFENDLYVLFEINDDQIVYRDLNRLQLDNSDQIRVLLQLPNGDLRHYLLVARAPGRMSIYLVDENWKLPIKGEAITTFIAEMAETEWGYRVELRIPRNVIGTRSRLGYFAVDVDNIETREITRTLSTSPRQAEGSTGQVLLNSPELTKILKGLDRPQSRIWILDKEQRVRAVVGGLSANIEQPEEPFSEETWLLRLYRKAQRMIDNLLKKPSDQFVDVSTDVTSRPDKIFARILKGEPLVQARPSLDQKAQIIVAGYPIRSEQSILGAVIVEQSSNAIMERQFSLLRSLTLVTLLVFAFVLFALLIFAWRLTARIRRLYQTTEQSITAEGRVLEDRIPTRTYPRDELGDLGRSITGMLTRLSGYTRYLEGMPDTLAHEMNNPLNVVSSSLEILQTDLPGVSDNKHMQRAQNGVGRLRAILTSLTEAANLEDAMRDEIKQKVDINALVSEIVGGYNLSYPQYPFYVQTDPAPLWINGSPDHLAQMFDKIVDNAVQFSTLGSSIIVRIAQSEDHANISILNEGPTIPEKLRERLFDPMVSYGKTNAKQSHLGLGLFVVRLISEYHNGSAWAENRADVDGVIVTVSIPLV
ncbi:MAG: HAMP domain-containing protein [Acidiferrobacterales bacterium]|nr:HAMP domain-containing protein [Acidiferrobacterales bacterium]